MGSYREIERELREKTDLKILILDNGYIQFLFKHSEQLPHSILFEPYDLVLIPGWVYAEYSHHSGKVDFMSAIPKVRFVDEFKDYMLFSGSKEKKLFDLFKTASPNSESIRFFNQYRTVDIDDMPEDWIMLYYNNGFLTTEIGTRTTRKNAGEVSILTLAFLLLDYYGGKISSISIGTNDHGVTTVRNKILKDAEKLNLALSKSPPLSFVNNDVTLFHAIKLGIISPDAIERMQRNPKRTHFVEHFTDGTSAIHHDVVLETTTFIEMCREPDRYTILF